MKSNTAMEEDLPDEITVPPLTDPVAMGRIMADVAARSRPLIESFLEKNRFDPEKTPLDPFNVRPAYMALYDGMAAHPETYLGLQQRLMTDWMDLWLSNTRRFLGEGGADDEKIRQYLPDRSDRRYRAPAWDDNPMFAFLKQSHILMEKWTQEVINTTEGLDEQTRRKLSFHMRQVTDALAPANYPFTNPEVIQETLDTKGENLIQGLQNLLEDMERGHGALAIRKTDYDAFSPGENLAITPGKVIARNDLMELIQYEPVTEKVHKTPILIVPPWINKYYILDLQPKNSLVSWLVEQGHTVFTISWVNPDAALSDKTFEDYMTGGVLAAMDEVEKATGEKSCNLIGYCLGGTLIAVTLAVLAAKGQAGRVASSTFLTTLLDFTHAGDLQLFMDDAQIEMMEREMADKGVFPAESLRNTFSMLRANDLIWSFFINNYLMGREPFPFDILYWNDDSTNMPAAMHSFYIRAFYRDNLLAQPGGIEMGGVKVDLSKIKTPCHFLSTREDHIAPWRATYEGAQLLGGLVTFTLAESGHVAGVINPPSKGKYGYNVSGDLPADSGAWLEGAVAHEGSWWPFWNEWVANYAGPKVKARKPGKGLCHAPGTYVKMRADG